MNEKIISHCPNNYYIIYFVQKISNNINLCRNFFDPPIIQVTGSFLFFDNKIYCCYFFFLIMDQHNIFLQILLYYALKLVSYESTKMHHLYNMSPSSPNFLKILSSSVSSLKNLIFSINITSHPLLGEKIFSLVSPSKVPLKK